MLIFLIPGTVFILLVMLEWRAPQSPTQGAVRTPDRVLNFTGLAMQGCVVPLAAWFVATELLQPMFPAGAGSLQIGFWGALAFNLVVIDFLYYWQHRAFHGVDFLWRFHLCHHAAPLVNIWVTARNSLPTHFLFVYFLINPVAGYLCDSPSGFFLGAMITAALDVVRHANVDFNRLGMGPVIRLAGNVLVTPMLHHQHHANPVPRTNYGANLIVWDRLFGTLDRGDAFPRSYGLERPPSFWRQLILPPGSQGVKPQEDRFQ